MPSVPYCSRGGGSSKSGLSSNDTLYWSHEDAAELSLYNGRIGFVIMGEPFNYECPGPIGPKQVRQLRNHFMLPV